MRNPYSKFNGTVSHYKHLHRKVAKVFGTPSECEDCGTTEAKRYDWANLGNNYGYPYVVKREDWKRLCRSCHQKLDAALFEGKRFTGKKHKPESRAKTTETLKKYWAEHPEQMKELVAKRVATRKRNKELRSVTV